MKFSKFARYYPWTYKYWREGMLRAAEIVDKHFVAESYLAEEIRKEAEQKKPKYKEGEHGDRDSD